MGQRFMFAPEHYQLLDFGRGEKLESFAGQRVRRETPSVDTQEPRSASFDWTFDLRYHNHQQSKQWASVSDDKSTWKIRYRTSTFNLKPTPAGQLGVFPEQACNWDWIANLPGDLKGLNALNLFAYTGGTTMALAARGVNVTHVDAAANVVKWARANAADSGMVDAPIRWIIDDAMKFVGREIKRDRKYDILVADPPSYGTGPKNQKWLFEKNIDELLAGLAQLASDSWRYLLITCHTPGFDGSRLVRMTKQHFSTTRDNWQPFEMTLDSLTGKQLPSGSGVRFG